MKKNTKQESPQKISVIERWLRTEPYAADEKGKVLKFKMLGYDEKSILVEEIFEPGNKILRRTYFDANDDGQYQMNRMVYYYYNDNNEYKYHLVIYDDGVIELVEGDDPIAFISDICEDCLGLNKEPETNETSIEQLVPSQTIPSN